MVILSLLFISSYHESTPSTVEVGGASREASVIFPLVCVPPLLSLLCLLRQLAFVTKLVCKMSALSSRNPGTIIFEVQGLNPEQKTKQKT